MDLMLDIGTGGQLACTIVDRDQTATIVAANALDGARDLAAALADARDGGYGECVWPLSDGEFKWLFRRTGDRTEVVVLWSSGTLTGWQQVFRSEAEATALEQRVAEGMQRIAPEGQ